MTGNRNEELSKREYNFYIGILLLWGFGLNAFMCKFCTQYLLRFNKWLILILYLVIAISGVIISSISDKIILKFLSYNMVVIPFGAVLSILLGHTNKNIVFNTIVVTVIMVVIMLIVAMIYPDFILSLGWTLSSCLMIVAICELIFCRKGFQLIIWNILVCALFCCYIAYDWVEAQKRERTMGNAIDSVMQLYVEIMNLFVRVLKILSELEKN